MIGAKVGERDFKVGCHIMQFVSSYGKRSVGTFKYTNVFLFVFVRA